MTVENLSKEELQEKFELFLFNMDDILEAFVDKLESKGITLDYSLNSLTLLESYLSENKVTIKDDDYNDASEYLGEVVRLKYGGKWICNLDDKDNSLYYGYPVIAGHSKFDVLFSPFHSVRIYLIRPRENHFKIAIESDINPEPLNLDRFPTED